VEGVNCERPFGNERAAPLEREVGVHGVELGIENVKKGITRAY
jgi:hypothetical protein